MDNYKVIVVGGGHAGIEAALATARLGVKTALVTMSKEQIGRMSCNPSVGGLAKSHIVSEVDALGGEIGVNSDFTGIHYRTLNTRKGPAVQAIRIQCDKLLYPYRMQSVIATTANLAVVEGQVAAIVVENDQATGVRLATGQTLPAQAVILAPGTFLSGRIHIGQWWQNAGRIEDSAALELSQNLKDLGFRMNRLKTGTPPRIHKESLDYSKMEVQPGEQPPPLFSRTAKRLKNMFHVKHEGMDGAEYREMFHVEHCGSDFPVGFLREQIPCYLTHTTEETHSIISDNLEQSSLYSGSIQGTGVRYCPSIEDKIVKFPHHRTHNVFIEPEGRDSVRIYPNGTSNSLPEDVQTAMIHSIPGMEAAEIIRPGYAIEYDFCDPLQLWRTLETKKTENLYMAGQINGTTGYEEAAGQGIVAGVNAVLKLKGERPFVLERDEAYIGVLIDDLVTKGTEEPYRMFTSRAEYRLSLRQDNAVFRLVAAARRIGLLSQDEYNKILQKQQVINREIDRLESVYSEGASLAQILRRPENKYGDIPDVNLDLSDEEVQMVETEVKYAGYIKRERKGMQELSDLRRQKIPADFDFDSVPSLRAESREKLNRVRPENLAQASRISGINPSDIAIMAVMLKRK